MKGWRIRHIHKKKTHSNKEKHILDYTVYTYPFIWRKNGLGDFMIYLYKNHDGHSRFLHAYIA